MLMYSLTCIWSSWCHCHPIISCFIKPRLHNTTCCQTGLATDCIVYTNIHPFDNRFDNQLYRVYSRLLNRIDNPIDNWLNEQWLYVQHGCQTGCQSCLTTGCIHDTAGWMFVYMTQPVVITVWQPVCNRLYRINKHPTGCQTGLTTGWMFVYTIQLVVKPVLQTVWHPVVSCKRGIKIQNSFTFLVPPYPGCPEKEATKRMYVCPSVCCVLTLVSIARRKRRWLTLTPLSSKYERQK